MVVSIRQREKLRHRNTKHLAKFTHSVLEPTAWLHNSRPLFYHDSGSKAKVRKQLGQGLGWSPRP